jgi:hypothetical protein
MCTKPGIGWEASPSEACQAKPCSCLSLGLNDDIQSFGLQLDYSIGVTSFPSSSIRSEGELIVGAVKLGL